MAVYFDEDTLQVVDADDVPVTDPDATDGVADEDEKLLDEDEDEDDEDEDDDDSSYDDDDDDSTPIVPDED